MIEKRFKGSLLVAGIVLGSITVMAADVVVQVTDMSGDAIADAVVYVATDEPVTISTDREDIVDQIDKEFVPRIKVIQTGTSIVFPNMDNIRHQVYSFSPAKTFEIPLYKGTPAQPIMFNKPGIVSLGCNIHDWMTGYIFIVNSPYFSITDAKGKATLSNLQEGDYHFQVWHPTLKGEPQSTNKQVTLTLRPKQIQFSIKTKKVWSAWRGSGTAAGGYR